MNFLLTLVVAYPTLSVPVSSLVWLVGIAISWYIAYLTVKREKRADRHSFEKDVENVVRKYTQSDEYLNRKERRMREIAQELIDQEFAKRGSSFVADSVFREYRDGVERRIGSLESAIRENTKEMADFRRDLMIMRSEIASECATQVVKLLNSRIIVPGFDKE